jgi:hypothetical protein
LEVVVKCLLTSLPVLSLYNEIKLPLEVCTEPEIATVVSRWLRLLNWNYNISANLVLVSDRLILISAFAGAALSRRR